VLLIGLGVKNPPEHQYNEGWGALRVNPNSRPTNQQPHPSGPRQTIVANLAVRYVALLPCTCRYLGGAASRALGRTARGHEGRRRLHDTTRRVCLHQDDFCCRAHLVVISMTYNSSSSWFMGSKILFCASVASP
jgi:hypothetical protein